MSETTEASNEVIVVLSWRAFPCTADRWDGHRRATLPLPVGGISSPEALRSLLFDLAMSDWSERLY